MSAAPPVYSAGCEKEEEDDEPGFEALLEVSVVAAVVLFPSRVVGVVACAGGAEG